MYITDVRNMNLQSFAPSSFSKCAVGLSYFLAHFELL